MYLIKRWLSLINWQTPTTPTEKWFNDNSTSLSIWEPTISGGLLQRSLVPISDMTKSGAKKGDIKSNGSILLTVLRPTPNKRTLTSSRLKLLLARSSKCCSKSPLSRWTKEWLSIITFGTQSHFGLKGK